MLGFLQSYLSRSYLNMSSKKGPFNRRKDYWQPAALKSKVILTDDGYPPHDLYDKRRSGQEVFEMGCSQEKEESLELKRPEDAVVPLSKIKLGFIILALCLAVFLVALDQTIIATAVPEISAEFQAMDDVGW